MTNFLILCNELIAVYAEKTYERRPVEKKCCVLNTKTDCTHIYMCVLRVNCEEHVTGVSNKQL